MAKIGLNNFKYGILTEAEDGTPKYGGAKSFGKAVECKVSIENNSAELYADDGLAESDYSFKKGTVTLTVDEENDKIFAELLGHTVTEEYVATKDKTPSTSKTYYTKTGDSYTKFTGESFTSSTTYYEKNENGGEVVKKDTDTPPFVGVGRIITKVVNGVYKYKAEFLVKVKFAEPSPEEKTKGEEVEFATTEVEGTVMKLADGTWCKSKTFETKEEAVTYLTNLMKASE